MTNSTPTVPAVPPVNGRTVIAGAGLTNAEVGAIIGGVLDIAIGLVGIFYPDPKIQQALLLVAGVLTAVLATFGIIVSSRARQQSTQTAKILQVQATTSNRELGTDHVADLEARLSRVEAMVSPEHRIGSG